MGLDVWAIERTAEEGGRARDPEVTFRDCYNDLSLANWLARNVDASARGAWGLAIFTEPQPPLNTPEWRARLLELASGWVARARVLRGTSTAVGYPEDPGRIVDADATADYIEECEWLFEFARTVHDRGLDVAVWA